MAISPFKSAPVFSRKILSLYLLSYISFTTALHGKRGRTLPRISIWPLYDPIRHDASVWPRAGSHIGHFCPIRILGCASVVVIGAEPDDAIGVASLSGCNNDNGKPSFPLPPPDITWPVLWKRTMSHFYGFILLYRTEKALAFPLRLPYFQAALGFYAPSLFRDNSGRLVVFTGHWRSREVKPSS